MYKNFGFTLLEVLIVLSLIAIFSIFLVPSFKSIFEKNQEKVASEQLLRAIAFAKSEAIALGQPVLLSKKDNWNDGYVVHTNENTLFMFQNKNNYLLHWRAFPRDIDELEFLATGFSNFENGTFWYCPLISENPVWAIMLSQSGHVRLVYPDAEGKIIDEKGNPLRC